MRYAKQTGVAGVITSYLDYKPDNLTKVETVGDRKTVVTPRGWEDLSANILMREKLDIPVTQDVMSQYLQNPEIAEDFTAYYDLYQTYRKEFDTNSILAGTYDEALIEKCQKASVDERIALLSLLTEKLTTDMSFVMNEYAEMKEEKDKILSIPEEKRESKLAVYRDRLARLKTKVEDTQSGISAVLAFLKAAFAQQNEVSLFVNDLVEVPEAASFIAQFMNLDYIEASKELSLHEREQALIQQITL